MNSLSNHLWLIPAAPLMAAGIAALLRRGQRRLTAGLAIGAMAWIPQW